MKCCKRDAKEKLILCVYQELSLASSGQPDCKNTDVAFLDTFCRTKTVEKAMGGGFVHDGVCTGCDIRDSACEGSYAPK